VSVERPSRVGLDRLPERTEEETMRTKLTHVGNADVDLLFDEIERYLDVVAAFRAEGVEPVYADNEWLWRLFGHVLVS
jgi:hypothetical protein